MRKAKAAAKVENPTPTKEELEAQQLAVLDKTIETVKEAQRKYAEFTQEQVDAIFRAGALAANNARIELAKMAVEETGMGVVEDKVIKNHFASEYIYHTVQRYEDLRNLGA